MFEGYVELFKKIKHSNASLLESLGGLKDDEGYSRVIGKFGTRALLKIISLCVWKNCQSCIFRPPTGKNFQTW